jgi:hypothetical protein
LRRLFIRKFLNVIIFIFLTRLRLLPRAIEKRVYNSLINTTATTTTCILFCTSSYVSFFWSALICVIWI